MTISNGVVAITGAGMGLGLGLAAECARRGFRVLATVLDPSMREAVESATVGLPGRVQIETLDITRPGSFEFPQDLAVLINNAGIRQAYLPIEETPLEQWRALFEVNFFGAVEITRRAIPILRARGSGVICNINSASHLMPMPFNTTYRASKAALASFSESLRTEMAPFGVRIVEIHPGPMLTHINTDSIVKRTADAVGYPAYAPMARRQREVFDAVPLPVVTPAAAAGRIVDAILDESGPMRYGTCALSDGILNTWRNTTDEEQMISLIRSLET